MEELREKSSKNQRTCVIHSESGDPVLRAWEMVPERNCREKSEAVMSLEIRGIVHELELDTGQLESTITGHKERLHVQEKWSMTRGSEEIF
jgi:hypothetical protein